MTRPLRGGVEVGEEDVEVGTGSRLGDGVELASPTRNGMVLAADTAGTDPVNAFNRRLAVRGAGRDVGGIRLVETGRPPRSYQGGGEEDGVRYSLDLHD